MQQTLVQLVGADHVGFGFDYVYDMPALATYAQTMKDRWPAEGGYTRPDVAQIEPEQTVEIVATLMEMGYGADDLRKIVGGNWLRVMTNVWK